MLSMNSSVFDSFQMQKHRYFSNGLQRYALFLNLQTFSIKFSQFFNKKHFIRIFALKKGPDSRRKLSNHLHTHNPNHCRERDTNLRRQKHREVLIKSGVNNKKSNFSHIKMKCKSPSDCENKANKQIDLQSKNV